jgi:hypothetical protein
MHKYLSSSYYLLNIRRGGKEIMDNTAFRQILSKLPQGVKDELEMLPQSVISEVEEIRMRCGQHVRLQGNRCEKIISHIHFDGHYMGYATTFR